MKPMSFGCLALVGALLFSSSHARAGDCVPGAQTQCACPGGTVGVQVCSDDGSRFGPCSSCTAPAQPAVTTLPPPNLALYAPPPEMRRRSPGVWAGGLTLFILGLVAMPAGGATIAAGAADGGCDKHDSDAICGAGGGLIAGGALFVGVGISMMVSGGHRVPVVAPQSTWWKPASVAVSPTGGRMVWAF